MNNTSFIKNEKESIQESFEKGFYYTIAIMPLLREMIFILGNAAKASKDAQTIKKVSILTLALSKMMFSIEQFESKFKVENNKSKEEIRTALKERAEIIAISLSRIPVERHPEFIAMLQDFYQGNFKHVDESYLDAIIGLEDENSVEGLGFVHRINPNLSVEQKESFAKEMVNWANMRSKREAFQNK